MKQFAAAAAQQAGPGFGNFMGAAMGSQQQGPPVGMPSPMSGPGQFYQASNAPSDAADAPEYGSAEPSSSTTT
jgi:hypothetical protein